MEGLNFKRGFTLIELLVVTGIIILLSALFLANYDLMQWQIDLDTQAQKMMSVLKQAQAMALTGKKIGGVRPDGFGVYFGANSYILFADSNSNHTYDTGNDSIVQSFNLTEEMSLNATTSIVFTVPEAKTYRDGDLLTEETYLKLTHSKSDASKQVRINTYGRIEISSSSLLDSLWSYRRPVTIDSTQQLDNYQIALDITDKIYNNTNLVGSWHLNEGTGTSAADTSGNGNDGTLTNGPTWVDGKYGKALSFDGSNDYVDCGTNFFGADYSTTNNISVEMWIKADKINTHQALFDKHTYPSNYGYGCGMWLNNNNKIEVEVGNGGSGTGSSRNLTSLQAGMWYHVVWVANGTTGRIYINGVDDSDLTAALKIYQNAPVAVWIGKAHSTFRYIQPTVPDNFNGLIDEVRIYSRALTSTEISDLYNASKARLDYGDLRFGDASRSTLSYWLESDKKAWVKISFLPASTTTPIYMYYGNSAASSASNGTTTFLAYADSNDYSTQFTSDSASVEGNEIKISSTPGWATGWIKANENLDRTTTNYELVFNMRSTGISPNDDETYGGFGSSNMMSSPYTDSGSFVAGSSALEIYEYTSQKYSSATGYDYTINNEFKIKINSTNRYYYLNNALLYTSSDTTTVAKTGITLYGNGPIYFKNIRLRKYASSEPAVAAPSNEQDVNNKGWLYGDYYAQNLATVPSPVSFDSLNVTCPSCQSLAATWTPSLWAERYKYDRCNNVSDCSGCNSGNTSSTNVLDGFCQSTQCSVTDSLTEGTGYCYKLYAYNSTGSTQNSDGSKFKQTPYCPPPQMGVNGYECGKLKTSWCRQGQENTDGYLVYRSLLSDGCNTTSSPTCEITGFLGEALDDNGLVGHWKLNETSGAVIDSSGLGNNGTNYGATTGVAGKFNKAYSFDGANDYVSVPYGDFVNESFSWSGWIKIDTNDYRMITDDRNTSSWNGWYIRHRGDNGDGSRIFDFYVKNASGQTGITGTTQPNLGQWYHLVVTYEYIGNGTSKMNMYVNGAKDATEITNAYGVDAASADNRIGCYSGGGGAWVDGIIDNVAIYNRALTPEEIRKAYEASPLSSSCVYTCNGSKFCNPTSDTCCNTLYCNNKTCIYPDRKVIPDVNYYYRTISTTGANKSDFSDKVSGKTICVPPSLMREK